MTGDHLYKSDLTRSRLRLRLGTRLGVVRQYRNVCLDAIPSLLKVLHVVNLVTPLSSKDGTQAALVESILRGDEYDSERLPRIQNSKEQLSK